MAPSETGADAYLTRLESFGVKTTTPTWLDPTFYAFLMVGLLLLGSGLCCQVQAGRATRPGASHLAISAALLAPATQPLPPTFAAVSE